MTEINDEIIEHLESTAPENYRFHNEPQAISEDELGRYLGDLQKQSVSVPGLIGIYQDPLKLSGQTVRIKLILVNDSEYLDPMSRSFSDVIRVIGTRNVLDENFLNVDRKILENMPKFDPLIEPQFLSGQEVAVTEPQNEEIRFFYIARLLDLFCAGYLEKVFRVSVLRTVDTAATLALLREIQRLIKMIKVILRKKTKEEWDPLDSSIQSLLDEWLDLGVERYGRLMEILHQLPVLLFSMIDQLNGYFERVMVAKVRLSPDATPPQALLATERIVTAFVEPWSAGSAFRSSLDMTERLEQFISVLPVSFGLQLHQYSTRKSLFNRHVKAAFQPEGLDGNLERPYITWDRGQLLDRYCDLLVKMRAGEDPEGLLMDCEIPSGSALGRAGDMVGLQKSKMKLKKLFKFLRDEAGWESAVETLA